MSVKRDPFAPAIQKGREAYLAGRSEKDCPYPDTRKEDGRLTFSRAWRHAWLEGYRQQRNDSLREGMLGD